MQTGNNVLGQANDFLKNLDNLLNNPFVQKMVSGKENARKGSEPSVQQAQPQMVSSPPPQAPPPQQQQPAPQQQQAQTQQIEDKRTTPEQLHKLMVHFLKGVIDRKEDATCAELLADLQEHREEFIARVEQSIKAAQEQKADETEEEPIEEEEEDNGEDQDATN